MFSNTILKRFIKDYSLPIQVIQEPYFEYFIDLYNPLLDTRKKLDLLKEAVGQFANEEAFLQEYYDIRDKIITTIETTDIYKQYNSMDMSKYNVSNKDYPSTDVFKCPNIGKVFVSIDLKKANFQALKYIDNGLVLNCNTYEELIGKFTDLEYMKSSKYLRQVIFGNMNPKRQVKVERYIIQQILDFLIENKIINLDNIKSVSNDEIVFEADNFIDSYNDIADQIKKELNFNVDVEIYRLNNIGNLKFFVKEFINKPGYEIMCVPMVYFAQAYKKYNNLEIKDMDLSFYYEHQICRFMNPLNFEGEVDKK